ncbi:hypothetical protein JRO89_XS14G0074700 [Xanthoceras sorbifolium]|uniref:Uncharacterized protein n=1 Tax=Xanthoceras sorbifolium TaxID=99658 RepID=A0ABQ8H4F4_9ROSI|nr:hypothetical protein JRO89_XS14G0074700 [Xanthoceras sorbifolium]
MAIIAILRRSASSLAPLASRLAGVNINYHSAVFGTALSHLNRKQTMKYVVPAFDFSSAIEIQNLTLDELLPQIIDLELKFADHDSVSEIPSDFPFKIKDSCGNKYVVLTREYNSELVEAVGCITPRNDVYFNVFISKYGGHGPSLYSRCEGTLDKIKICRMEIIDLENLKDSSDSESEDDSDELLERYEENLKKAFLTKLEIRGIKSSTLEFLLDYKINKAKINKLMKLKKIKNSIEQLS